MSQDECKLLSEQITTRVDAETGELRNANQILMLELQQRDQDLAKVSILFEHKLGKPTSTKFKLQTDYKGWQSQVGRKRTLFHF